MNRHQTTNAHALSTVPSPQPAAAPLSPAAEVEVAELQEEFARRLGAADRTIAQLQDDKERLRAQLVAASQGSGASEARAAEREEHIRQLQ
jgi:FKBP-type peptidyl-prolyl cis-trans isomerase (trigger factor)